MATQAAASALVRMPAKRRLPRMNSPTPRQVLRPLHDRRVRSSTPRGVLLDGNRITQRYSDLRGRARNPGGRYTALGGRSVPSDGRREPGQPSRLLSTGYRRRGPAARTRGIVGSAAMRDTADREGGDHTGGARRLDRCLALRAGGAIRWPATGAAAGYGPG